MDINDFARCVTKQIENSCVYFWLVNVVEAVSNLTHDHISDHFYQQTPGLPICSQPFQPFDIQNLSCRRG